MKADYKNWVPKGMVISVIIGTVAAITLFIIFGATELVFTGTPRMVFFVILLIVSLIMIKFSFWSVSTYKAFSYNGKRQLSRQIIEGTASFMNLPEGGKCLDVGCGSGALTIAVAKKNPKTQVTGIDRWGKEYSSFSKMLCMQNAKAEGVSNTVFENGNATALSFSAGTFDGVVSNYVYHNIAGYNKQELLLETLRTLKKGGSFAIHDLMSKRRYGDMQAFKKKLEAMGYEEVKLIDTTDGMFMTKRESVRYALTGSTLLVGKK